MRFIPTYAHGVVDYVIGIVLIAAPWLFDFDDGTAAMWVPIILGAGTIVYSLLTDYELSVVRMIPMHVHLWLDGAFGLVLAVSPWLFGFADRVWIPHLVVGLFEIVTALCTQMRATVGPRIGGPMQTA